MIRCSGAFLFLDFDTCEEVDLSGAIVSQSDIQPLCANLGRFKLLKTIDLSDNKLSDLGGRLIAEGLKSNCSVTIVRLTSSNEADDIFGDFEQQMGNDSETKYGISDVVRREIT